MASVNKVILIGNLGNDPETRYMPDGKAVTTISLATTDKWKDKNGEKQEKTEWHRVKFFGRPAEIAGEYLKKGLPVYIEGNLRTQKWTDKQNVERYTTEIIANNLQLLERRPQQSGGQNSVASQSASQTQNNSGFDDMDEDIPF